MLVVDTGFSDALNHLRSVADGNGNTKGKLFERLMQSFLKTYPLYVDRFEDVWLWNDYPERNGRTDFGIDLVGKEKDGSLCAIQCKFYDGKILTKRDIDSFLEAGSRSKFQSMMLFYSGSGYGRKVEEALVGHGCKVVNFESLASSNVAWPDLAAGLTEVKRGKPYNLWDHQKKAISGVTAGLEQYNRGQLIMACGTGKTLTSCRMAEQMVGVGGLILYAVPSISLMRQAIRYWSEHRTMQHSYVGVCSDPTVSHGEKTDIPIIEMDIGVSTDHNRIAPAMARNHDSMTVVFTTYQSMEAIKKAQEITREPFDLILCDEAHRTTGVEQGSPFTLIHDDMKVRVGVGIMFRIRPKWAVSITILILSIGYVGDGRCHPARHAAYPYKPNVPYDVSIEQIRTIKAKHVLRTYRTARQVACPYNLITRQSMQMT